MENALKQVIADIDENKGKNIKNSSVENNQDIIKNNFINTLKKDIEKKLVNSEISVIKVEVFVNDDYEIEKIEIKINNLKETNAKFSNVTEVVKYINSEYGVSFVKISVVEEGI